MCGIVGYAGRDRAAEILFEGLKKLEYRGYDSAGISTRDRGEIFTAKRGGRVEGLRLSLKELKGTVGIGHTRWATHGEANDANAHPHAFGRFAVVHNGIIENHAELRAELRAAGHAFASQTDSEVVAHLLDFYYEGDLADALRLACARLKGCWALAVLCADFDGFAVTRRGSSLILGRGEGFMAASDICALGGRSAFYCVPEEGDIALVTPSGIEIFDAELSPVGRAFSPVRDVEPDSDKGDCPHYMLREIGQNARTVRATCASVARLPGLKEVHSRLGAADRIALLGCGTAYNAALAGVRLLGGAYDACVTAHIASEARFDPPGLTARSVCIAVSQSGETADTVMAARAAREAGAYLVAVTNVGYSAITRVADKVIPVCAGTEICVAATKSYVGQLACLHILASPGRADVRAAQLLKTADGIERVVADGRRALDVARLCVRSRAVFFIGRGADADAAVEGSLKLKEVSYIFSDGYPAGELKHGTLALVDESVLAIVLITDEGLAEKCENAVEQILSRRGRVAVVTTLADVHRRLSPRTDAAWLLPPAPAHLSHFLTAAALQLVAYRAALLRGCDPDKPRNLAKSVTVE